MEPKSVLDWWFSGDMADAAAVLRQAQVWFGKGLETDHRLRERFGDAVVRAAAGEFDAWIDAPDSCLALVLLLDQLPRNIWRGAPQAWSLDTRALAVATTAVSRGFDRALAPVQRVFMYLPFEHAEDRDAQEESVRLFGGLAHDAPLALRPLLQAALEGAEAHAQIVARFGRFPHRNAIIGRTSTEEEVAFLLQPGSSF